MHNNILKSFLAGLTLFPVSALSQQILFPSSLDVSLLTALQDKIETRSTQGEIFYNCIVEFKDNVDPEVLCKEYDITFNTLIGKLATVLIPYSQLNDFASNRGIVKISSCETKPMTDKAAEFSNVNTIHSLSTPFKGKGVLIGVIDSGFDYGHSSFKDSNGECRIAAVWDQNLPISKVGHLSDFGYGYVLDNPSDISAMAHDMSQDTHGTHVAAIAASSADIYQGMAPEADIVLVSTDKTEAGMIDALKFLLDYSETTGKPISINISFGKVIGFKDGTDELPYMIDRLMEERTGQIVSIAAGNEGHRKSTVVTESESNGISSRLILPSYNRENLFIGSSERSFSLNLTLHNESGEIIFENKTSTDSENSELIENFLNPSDGSFLAISTSINPFTEAPSISATLYSPLPDGWFWQAEVEGEPSKYIMTVDYGELSEGTAATTIACTACGYNIVSVGAYVSRTDFTNIDGDVCSSGFNLGEEYIKSGKGPTFDGRNKPDIIAPGAAVISAINSYASSFSINREDLAISQVLGDRTDYWGAMSGTSMATPVVTGVLALWLEADPTLTVSDIQELLAGMEKLDAMKGIESITDGIRENIFDSNDTTVVYDLMGHLLFSGNKADAVNNLKPGIYIICSGSQTEKILIGY